MILISGMGQNYWYGLKWFTSKRFSSAKLTKLNLLTPLSALFNRSHLHLNFKSNYKLFHTLLLLRLGVPGLHFVGCCGVGIVGLCKRRCS